MSTKTIIRCDACDKTVEIDAPRDHVPEGWITLHMSRRVGGAPRGSGLDAIMHACSEKCVGFEPKAKTALHRLYRQALPPELPPQGRETEPS